MDTCLDLGTTIVWCIEWKWILYQTWKSLCLYAYERVNLEVAIILCLTKTPEGVESLHLNENKYHAYFLHYFAGKRRPSNYRAS